MPWLLNFFLFFAQIKEKKDQLLGHPVVLALTRHKWNVIRPIYVNVSSILLPLCDAPDNLHAERGAWIQDVSLYWYW